MNITDRITKLVLERKPDVGPRGVKRAIANACGISYEAVRQWYAGDTGNIKNENLAAVADKFDTTVDWLLSGEGEPPRRRSSAETVRIAQAVPGAAQEPARAGQVEADQGAQEAAHYADMLAIDATPRSREILWRIVIAANEGRLTEDDLNLLDQIAARFESRKPNAATTPARPHQRLREKLKRND